MTQAPLRPEHVLTTVALAAVRGRPSRPRTVHVGDVVLGQPLAHPAPDAPDPVPPGNEAFGIWLAFDLRQPRAVRHRAVYLRLRFDDSRVTIVGMEATADRLGLTHDDGELRARTAFADHALLAARRSRPGWPGRTHLTGATVSSDGLGTPAAGLLFEPTDSGVLPDRFAAHAVITAPRGLPDLTGTLRVDLTTRLPAATGTVHAAAPEPAAFTLSLPRDRAGPDLVVAAGPEPVHDHEPMPSAHLAPDRLDALAPVPQAGVRLCMAADIEKFSRFRTPEAVRAQQRFVELLEIARRHAGVEVETGDVQKAGDGQFTVLPAGIDETMVIPRLVDGLWKALSTSNADLSDRARLRLRVALHRGHVAPGINGWVGHSSIAVHRLLDSAPLRAALTDHPQTDFVLIVSDVLYRDVVPHGFGGLDPDAFTPAQVAFPAKAFDETAWIYVPGYGR